MITKTELLTELERSLKERDDAIVQACGFWGDAPGIEKRIKIVEDDIKMLSFFIVKAIQLLPDDTTPSTVSEGER